MKEQGSGIDVDMFPFPQEAFPRTSKCLLLGGERLKGQGLQNVSYLELVVLQLPFCFSDLYDMYLPKCLLLFLE